MAGKKGMKHYSSRFKAEVLERIDSGQISLRGFCRESGIERSVVQEWRRIQTGKVIKIPRKKGRPRLKPMTTVEELTVENKRLTMENELMRSFLKAAGRRYPLP